DPGGRARKIAGDGSSGRRDGDRGRWDERDPVRRGRHALRRGLLARRWHAGRDIGRACACRRSLRPQVRPRVKMDATIRIAVLHFAHETVTFLRNDTTLSDFIYPGSPAKGEALLKAYPKSYMGGFVKMAREFDSVEL